MVITNAKLLLSRPYNSGAMNSARYNLDEKFLKYIFIELKL